MDYGSSGVYDSPMATDYYVKRFGFMFGGGRSGMYGLEAMKVGRHEGVHCYVLLYLFYFQLSLKI